MYSAVAMPSRIEKDLADNARALLASPNLFDHLRQFRDWCVASAARRRQRRMLSMLNDRLLADIGITRSDAQFESAKPFWKV